MKRAPDRVDYEANLAEAALASGRFAEAVRLADKILADNPDPKGKDLSASDRLSMMFVAISALLRDGQTGQAKARLDEFVRYHKSLPPDFQRNWNYSGDRHFIEGRSIDYAAKSIVLTLVGLLEQLPTSTIDRVETLAAALN